MTYEYEGIVLNEPYHLSFPQVFKHKGQFYMLPETKQSNHVVLFKAKNFPFEWEISDTLIYNRKLEDPAILLSTDLNIISASEVSTLSQYVFTSDSLTGEWKEYLNYDIRRGNETRAGGIFFQVEDDWYLPLQNNEMGYGTGLWIFKIVNIGNKLSFTEVSNKHLGSTESISWFGTGMHHLSINKMGDNSFYVVYDGKKKNSNEKVWNYKASVKYNF